MTADGSSGDSSARDGAGGWGRSSSCAAVGACNGGGAATVTLRDEDGLRGRWRGVVDASAVTSGAGRALEGERTSGTGLADRRVWSTSFDCGSRGPNRRRIVGVGGPPDAGDLNTSKRQATKDAIRKTVTVTRAAGLSWISRRRTAINARAARALAHRVCPSGAADSTSTDGVAQPSLPCGR